MPLTTWLKNMLGADSRRTRRRRAQTVRAQQPPRLHVERLEDKLVLATIVFQQDAEVTINGIASGSTYTGTEDAELREEFADSNFEDAAGINIDGNDGGFVNQGLTQFQDIFGNGPGQIPTDATITNATLELAIFDPGSDVNVHRVLGAWSESTVTWNNFQLGGNTTPGIQGDGMEATAALQTFRGLGNPRSIDVTADLQAWIGGEANNGWAFTPTGSGGVTWDTSEGTTPPKLTVEFTADQPVTVTPTSLELDEIGASQLITISLDQVPTDDVTVTLTPDIEIEVEGQGAGTPFEVTLGPGNTSTTVEVVAINDSDFELDHTGLLTFEFESNDPAFNGIDELLFNIADDDNLPKEVTVTFQEGAEILVNGVGIGATYTGVEDASIRSDETSPQGDASSVVVDIDGGPIPVHGLTRFDNIFGSDLFSGQIPTGVEITNATLSVGIFDDGDDINVHRLLGNWDEATATWADFTLNGNAEGGVQPDGIEATVASKTLSGADGVQSLDVTDDVQLWFEGTDNFGWAFLPSPNTSDIQWFSSEDPDVPFRPTLEVTFNRPVPITLTDNEDLQVSEDGAVDSFTIALDETTDLVDEVTVTVTPDSQLDLGNGAGVPVNLTFDPFALGGLDPQTVDVAAFDDELIEGTHTGLITISATSDDPIFSGAGPELTVQVIDNEIVGVPITFQQDAEITLDGAGTGVTYQGTQDTDMQPDEDDPQGDNDEVNVDLSGLSHVVTEFGDLFGDGDGQIPLGSTITNATLTLNITNGGNTLLMHRLGGAWSEDTATWDNFQLGSNTQGGVQGDTDEATQVVRTVSGAAGVRTIDVTEDLALWAAGAENFGWAFTPSGTNGVDWDSSEAASISDRPLLQVFFVEPIETVQLTPESGSLIVSEEGVTDSFEVALDLSGGDPTEVVTVTITPDEQVNVGAGSGQELVLTFDPTVAGGLNPQTVFVSSADDAVAEGAHAGVITAVANSLDMDFDGVVSSLLVNIEDNESFIQQGLQVIINGAPTGVVYDGGEDAEIRSNLADVPDGNDPTISVDQSDGGVTEGLIKFDNLIGNAPGQIPFGSTITNAVLEVTRTSPTSGTILLSRMLVDWSEDTVTWDDFSGITFEFGNQTVTGGVANDGTEALALPDAGVTNPPVVSQYNVSQTVQAWANGEGNFGWVIRNTSGDGWDFATSEQGNPSLRPRLIVEFDAPQTDVIVVTETGGTTEVDEDGGTDTISVGLDTTPGMPTSVVNVTLSPNSQVDLGAGAGNAINLTFDPSAPGGLDAQDVTVTGADDSFFELLHSGTILLTSTSADPNYAGSVEQIEVQIGDNDPLPQDVTLTLQEGAPILINGLDSGVIYTGTLDTFLASEDADVAQGDDFDVNIDADSETTHHGLTRFENLFGSGDTQIPLGSIIQNATLSLLIDDDGDNPVTVHQVLGTWDESATWNSFLLNGNTEPGIQADGTEVTESLRSFSSDGGLQTIDVTEDLALWSSGAANFGWAFLPGAGSDVGWASSERPEISLRPELEISFLRPLPIAITQSDDSTDVTEDGATDTYTISLLETPTRTVEVTVTPDAQLDLGAGVGNSITLTFDPNVTGGLDPQTVTVSAEDDDVFEVGLHPGLISHTATSQDPNFDGILADLVVNIDDNDPEPPVFTLEFQQGQSILLDGFDTQVVYEGTEDAEIRSQTVNVDSNFGSDPQINIDGSDGGGANHGLFQFKDIFGDSLGQIPTDASITSATLSLFNTGDTGSDISLHRILGAWSESEVTWNNFQLNSNTTPGIQADGIEATPALQTFPGSGIPRELDVTSDLQAWLAGEENNGWGLVPTGGGGVTWWSSEGLTPPKLTVTVAAPVPVTLDEGDGVNVTEGGATDTYTISLDETPTDVVTITVTPDAQLDLGNGAGMTRDFVFDPSVAGGLDPQTVTVTAVDDTDFELLHEGTLTHSVTSNDIEFNGVLANVTVGITDDDIPDELTFSLQEGAAILINGVDSGLFYTGTQDTVIKSDPADGNFGEEGEISVDLDDSGAMTQALVRFDNLIGEMLGQIAPGSFIQEATLSFNRESGTSGTISVHQLLQDWDESTATWDTFSGNGVDIDDTEAVATPAATVTVPGDPSVFDVTETVQAWADGDDNFGWAFLTNSGDGWDFDTSEATPTGDRPVLTITLLQPVSAEIVESDGSTEVAEGGATDTYTVSLTDTPTDVVTITATPESQVDLGNGAGVPVDLVFNPGGPTTQTVTVTADDDAVFEAQHTTTITHSAASNDPDFSGLLQDVVVAITDNDPIPQEITLVLQEGADILVNGGSAEITYSGTQDAAIENDPDDDADTTDDENFGDDQVISVDLSTGGNEAEALIRFDNLIGDALGQVPEGSIINEAILSFTLASGTSGTISVHEMLQTWEEGTVTWNTFGDDGITTDDVEAAAAAVDAVTNPGDPSEFDVTASVQAWADGADNFGWALLTDSGDGWDFPTSEFSVIELRPQLIISLVQPLDIAIIESDDSTEVSEGGNTDTFTVSLQDLDGTPVVPTDVVTVTLTPDSELDLGAGAGVAIDLTFDPGAGGGLDDQEVTVTAVDDLIFELGPHDGVITISATSGDPSFIGVLPDLIVTVNDNEPIPVEVVVQQNELTTLDGAPQGATPYSGTEDAEIRDNDPDMPDGDDPTITVDQADGTTNDPVLGLRTARAEGLVKFNDLFGDGPGQIPFGATIVDAVLEIDRTSNTVGTINLHRMLVDWNESEVVWNDFSGEVDTDPDPGPGVPDVFIGGVLADGTEAVEMPDTGQLTPGDPSIWNVTDSVQAWSDGQQNYGWVLKNTSTDGYDFATSESGSPPRLIIQYGEPGPDRLIITETDGNTAVSEDGETDSYTVELDTTGGLPTDVVTVTVAPDFQVDLGEGAGQAITLTFDPSVAGGLDPQTVNVTAVDDLDLEGLTHTGLVIHSLSSNDPAFDGDVEGLEIDVADNEIPVVVMLQQDVEIMVDGAGVGETYTGNQDTEIAANNPNSPLGAATSIAVSATESEALVRFDNLFGDGPGQIPLGANIVSATLDVDRTDITGGEIFVYELTQDWNEASTSWSDFDFASFDGVTVSVESAANPVATPVNPTSFDVSNSLQRWANGETNLGWVLQNITGDAWEFSSSESADPANRPKLTVEFLPPPPPPVIITESNDSTAVSEDGQTDSFTVALETGEGDPTEVVTVVVQPDDQVDLGGGMGEAVTLTFDPSQPGGLNAQTVDVTAVDDSAFEGDHTSQINLTVESDDVAFNGLVSLTVDITDNDPEPPTNDPPTVDDGVFSLPENSPAGTPVGSVIASDPNAGDTLSFAIVGGSGENLFEIDNTGAITVAADADLDFETEPQLILEIEVSDDAPAPVTGTDTATVTISLIDTDENPNAPEVDDQSFSVDEGSAVGTVVGTVPFSDADADQTATIEITNGNLDGAFAIDAATGEITVANPTPLDFDANPLFTLEVTVSDDGTPVLTDTATVTISLVDIGGTNPNAPQVDDQAFSVDEASAVGTVVGTVPFSDADADQTATIEITNGNVDGAFSIDAATGEITVANPTPLDPAVNPQFDLEVTVSDDGTPVRTDTATVTVTVSPLGGTGDVLTVDVTFSEAINPQVEAEFDAYQAHLDAGMSDVEFDLPTLGLFDLVGFTSFVKQLNYGEFVGTYEELIRGGRQNDTLVGTEADDLIVGFRGKDTFIGNGGNDIFVGGEGIDTYVGGEGNDTILYDAEDNMSDRFDGGEGFDRAVAVNAGVQIGVDGYNNGLEAFVGHSSGDTVIQGRRFSELLDFSQTELTNIAEVDGGSGRDTIIASDLSAASYRGGSDNDTLQAGSQDATFLYSGTDNGFDILLQGSGTSVAVADSAGTTIGVLGFDNGVDEFQGHSSGDTIIQDSRRNGFLNFSNTLLVNISEIDGGSGNDTFIASDLSSGRYVGGPGGDAFFASSAQADEFVVGDGEDTITDFDPAEDLIVIESMGQALDFDALRDLVTQDGNDSIFDLGMNNTLRVLDTLFADLDEDDFSFLP